MKYSPLLLLCLFMCVPSLPAQSCSTDSLLVREIRAQETDPNISFELFKHLVFYNPSCVAKNTLLLHLVGTGDTPSSTTLFPALAANNGFHVINLKYDNNNGSAYGTCKNSTDLDCYLNFRKETLEGIDYIPDISVNETNSVYNRLRKLLQYLDAQFPSENWGQYLAGNDFNWPDMMVSGHSQGGGHAAVMAIDHPVQRVLMFASPNDYSEFFAAPAHWTNAVAAVPDSAYYGFINYYDTMVGDFDWQYGAWSNMGLQTFGDTVHVDHTAPPYFNTHQLLIRMDLPGLGLQDHNVMLLDEYTVDNQGIPLYLDVWKYMLGLSASTSVVSEVQSDAGDFKLYPNPCIDQITIEAGGISPRLVRVYDTLGNLIQTSAFNGIPDQLSLQLHQTEAGIYFIQLIDVEGKQITKAYIIE